jgi:hypothetical protein
MPKRHPAFKDLLPKHTQSESEYLKKGMESAGRCHNDLVLWRDYLVDGYHRLAIAHQLGWKEGEQYSFRMLDPKLSEEQVKDWIIVEHVGRRNMPPKIRDEMIYLLYQGRLSKRHGDVKREKGDKEGNIVDEISKDTAVSASTVDRAIKKGKEKDELNELAGRLPQRIQQQHVDDVCPLTATQVMTLLQHGQLNEIERALRVGQAKTTSDAFKMVTGKPLAKGKGKNLPSAETRQTQPQELVDGRKIPVPKELVSVFESLKPQRAHIRVLESELKAIEEVAQGRGGEYLADQLASVKVDLKNVITAMKESLPWAACPFCKGKGCKKQPPKTLIWCLGRGYLTKKQKGLKDETWARLDAK